MMIVDRVENRYNEGMNKKALLGVGALFLIIIIGFLLKNGVMLGSPPKVVPEKVYHVGILSGLDFFGTTVDGFKEGMTELGYIEGKNIIYDVQKSGIDQERYRAVTKKFVADKVDMIFVFPTEASLEAKAAVAGTDIPVVFVANIEGVNLIESIREPGNNITGVSLAGPDVAVRRLEMLHELAPHATKFFVPFLKGYPIIPPELAVLEPAAKALGVTLEEFPAASPDEIATKLASLGSVKGAKVGAIFMIVEPLTLDPNIFPLLGKFAAEQHIPLGGAYVTMGGYTSVFGIFPENIAFGKQAAALANKIFKGVPAGSIPVVTAEPKSYLNYDLAQTLGLTMTEEFLTKVDHIIRK